MSERPASGGVRSRGDLAVLVVLAGAVALYCYDAVSASTHVYNLILVAPLALIIFVLCAIEFVVGKGGDNAEPVSDVLPVMALFATYVLTLNWLGFDVGTMLFVGAFLWLQGERRIAWLAGYSLAFSLALTLFFSKMLPYPMPTLLLGLTVPGSP